MKFSVRRMSQMIMPKFFWRQINNLQLAKTWKNRKKMGQVQKIEVIVTSIHPNHFALWVVLEHTRFKKEINGVVVDCISVLMDRWLKWNYGTNKTWSIVRWSDNVTKPIWLIGIISIRYSNKRITCWNKRFEIS